jgi:flagellar basal body L-ring protein FlgH
VKRYLITAMVLVSSLALGKSIWVDQNPYASNGGIAQGDVLIVTIRDISNLRYSMETETSHDTDIISEPDTTITGFLPKAKARTKVNRKNNVRLTGKNNLNLSIAVRVLKRAGNNLAISGTKTYSINGTVTIITVGGLVNPSSIKGRYVDADYLADMTLEVRTIKRGFNIQRNAPENDNKASANLTEAEKQRIIVDYLNKVLSELTE